MGEVRKFLEYPMVIDWLQWADHPDKLGEIDGAQVTLTLISEYRAHIKDIESKLEKAKTALEKIASYESYNDERWPANIAENVLEGLEND